MSKQDNLFLALMVFAYIFGIAIAFTFGRNDIKREIVEKYCRSANTELKLYDDCVANGPDWLNERR